MHPVAAGEANRDTRGRGAGPESSPLPLVAAPYLWPLACAMAGSQAIAAFLGGMAKAWESDRRFAAAATPEWATPNTVALELPTMQLRDFTAGDGGQGTLICAPYALHAATVADFAPGHSIVETLQHAGLSRLFVTDWRSAGPDMRYFSIDSYLADLNIAVDTLVPPVDLIGLCQGGWLALVYAARFPEKVRRLVLVGAPIDVKAGESRVSRLAADLPMHVYEQVVQSGEGRVRGGQVLQAYGPSLGPDDAAQILQLASNVAEPERSALDARYRRWYRTTVDLPGVYYLQVIRWLFKENQIAAGRFVALGRTINLADVRAPLFLLAGRDDELVAAEQLLAAARLVGTASAGIAVAVEPCGHLSLFLGARTLNGVWRRIAHWLDEDSLEVAEAS